MERNSNKGEKRLGGDNLENSKEVKKIDKQKLVIILGILGLTIIIIAIALVLNIDNTKIPSITDEGLNVQVKSDVVMLENAVDKANTSQIETISNQKNDQADIILDAIGVDIKGLESYAANIDQKQSATHTLMIVRPKEDRYKDIKKSISEYVALKQQYFIDNKLEESKQYEIAKSAIVYEKDGYIALVMENKPREILDQLLIGIDNAIEERKNTEATGDMLEG